LRFILKSTLLLLTLLLSTWANAQETPSLAERMSASTAPLIEELKEADKKFSSGELNEVDLAKLRTRLEEIRAEALTKTIGFQSEIVDLIENLDRMSLPPAEGEPAEPAEITQRRKQLSEERAKVILAVKEAEFVSVRANDFTKRVLEARRSAFVSNLLRKHRLDGDNISVVRQSASEEFGRIGGTIWTWLKTSFQYRFEALFTVAVIIGFIGLLLRFVFRPFTRWNRRLAEAESVSQLSLTLNAFASVVVPVATLAIIAFSLHQLLGYLGLYRFRIDQIVPSILYVAGAWTFIWLLLYSLLRPSDAKRRLINVDDFASRKLLNLGLLIATIYGIDLLLARLFVIFSTPIEFTAFASLVTTVLIALSMVWALRIRLKQPAPEAQARGYRGWWPPVYWAVWIVALMLLLTTLAGYISLARFMVGLVVSSGSILLVAYLGLLTSISLSERGALPPTRLGSYLRTKYGATDLRLDQLGLVLSIAVAALVAVITLPLLASQWGYDYSEISDWGATAFTGFTIGGFHFSIGRIIAAIIVFALLVGLTRAIQRWVERKVFARTRLDSGLRNSMRSGIGYVGYFIAGLVALSWAGINLSNFALIAGALSVGIGFGLQNIVSNFVSGIIMLVERPIKVGDIINVGGAEGYVRKINVRATELETFDRLSVIIPNSEVINTAVGNWMHNDTRRRIVIAVGVAYGSDPEQVRELLLQAADECPLISKSTEPFVYFSDFGSSSLDFQLRVIIDDIDDFLTVENDLRFKVFKLFAENGIEIPFPQQDLHIRSGLLETSANQSSAPAQSKRSPAKTAKKSKVSKASVSEKTPAKRTPNPG